jgi:hypothetical protein
MNQRSIGWICGLLLGTLLAGCDRGVPLGPEGAVRSSVEIDLRAPDSHWAA